MKIKFLISAAEAFASGNNPSSSTVELDINPKSLEEPPRKRVAFHLHFARMCDGTYRHPYTGSDVPYSELRHVSDLDPAAFVGAFKLDQHGVLTTRLIQAAGATVDELLDAIEKNDQEVEKHREAQALEAANNAAKQNSDRLFSNRWFANILSR